MPMIDKTQLAAAFNDINLVDFIIKTPIGNLTAHNMGPNDVIISATPGNGGDVMNIFEGSTGQLLANKVYKIRNWSVTVRFLRHSLDYCRGTYLIQEIIDGNITCVGIELTNKNFGSDSSTYESLMSDQAFLINFAGLEVGAGASGDFEMTFKLSNAQFTSGEYKTWTSNYRDDKFPEDKTTIVFQGETDKYGPAENTNNG